MQQLPLYFVRLTRHNLDVVRVALRPIKAKINLLAEEAKVRFVGNESEHDEVRVEAVEAVPNVLRVPRLHFRRADIVHDLVLALARDVVPGVNHFHALPQRVFAKLLCDEVVEVLRELLHKFRPRRDAVRVEDLVVINVFARSACSVGRLGKILRAAEAARALLVHLGTRRDAIDRHVKHLSRLHQVHDPVDVREDAVEHLRSSGGGRRARTWEAAVRDADRRDEARGARRRRRANVLLPPSSPPTRRCPAGASTCG